jgi:hypothetical protein
MGGGPTLKLGLAQPNPLNPIKNVGSGGKTYQCDQFQGLRLPFARPYVSCIGVLQDLSLDVL